MALIKCPKCNHDISEVVESCPVCGFMYVQDAMNFLLQDCRTKMKRQDIIHVMGTDYKENPVKDKRYKTKDSTELRYDKDCFGLDGTMWFILQNDQLKKVSWYFVGKYTAEYTGKAKEISDYIHEKFGKPYSKELDGTNSGEFRWILENGDISSFECSVLDGWIHILVAVFEEE